MLVVFLKYFFMFKRKYSLLVNRTYKVTYELLFMYAHACLMQPSNVLSSPFIFHRFSPEKKFSNCLRLCFSRFDSQTLEIAASFISKSIKNALRT